MLDRIGAVMVKEVRQLARDRLTFGMIVGIPLMQMLLFGYAINFDVRNLRAAVVDDAGTSLSRRFIADLQASGVVEFAAPSAGIGELRRRMSAGEISVGVYVPPDFERRVIDGSRPAAQLLVDGSEPMVDSVARGLASVPLPRRDGVYGKPAPTLEVRTEYNPERRTAVQIVPALIGLILNMTMVIFTAAAIVRERERGNLELLIATPIRSWELMTGKLLPYVAIGLVQTTLILTVGSLLFDVPVNGSLLDLYLAALLFIAATLTLGLVISTLARDAVPGLPAGVLHDAAVDPAVGIHVPVRRHAEGRPVAGATAAPHALHGHGARHRAARRADHRPRPAGSQVAGIPRRDARDRDATLPQEPRLITSP